jgi:hypothetical protein
MGTVALLVVQTHCIIVNRQTQLLHPPHRHRPFGLGYTRQHCRL